VSRGVTTLYGDARASGRRIAVECSCAWVACDVEGCDEVVTAPDRSDAGDAVGLACEEGWTCAPEGDRCEAHAAVAARIAPDGARRG